MEATGYLDAVAGRSELQPWAALRRGELSLGLRKLDDAKSSYEQAAKSSDASPAVRASPEFGLAQIAAAASDYDNAVELLARAEPALASLGDERGMAEVFFQRGAIYKQQRAWPQAYTAYRNALDLYDRQHCKHPKQTLVYCALGDLRQLAHVGDEDARQLYGHALALATELSFDIGRAHALVGLALLDQQDGALVQARARFQKALTLYRTVGDMHRQARVHQLWSNL